MTDESVIITNNITSMMNALGKVFKGYYSIDKCYNRYKNRDKITINYKIYIEDLYEIATYNDFPSLKAAVTRAIRNAS